METPTGGNDFTLAVEFDTDSTEFTRGVEIGMLYERLRSEERPVRAIVHASNAEMVLRLAETFGVSAQAQDESDEWISVAFS